MDLKIFMELFKVPIWISGLLIILLISALDILPINRLRQWIVELWRWLTEGKIIFICLLVIAVAVFLGFFVWQSEVSIKRAGYFLQLIGMLFAINGLLNIRKHFRQPLLSTLFYDWLKRSPIWKRNVVPSASATIQISGTAKARAEVWIPDDADQSMEKRIVAIIKNLERIKSEQRDHASSIDEIKDSLEEHKESAAERNKKMEERIHSDLESLHTSDLIPSLVGLVWLTIGITMSTMALELHKWVH